MRTVERQTAIALGREIEAAVNPILAKHGMKPGRARTTYGDLFKVAIETTPIGAPNREESDWKAMALFYGLPVDALGKQIRMSGRGFTIVGLNTRARKSPVMLTEDASGRSFKAPVTSVLVALGVSPGARLRAGL